MTSHRINLSRTVQLVKRRMPGLPLKLLASLALALAPGLAQAGVIAGGTTQPSNGATHGYVSVQVYSLEADGTYGVGPFITNALLTSSGFGPFVGFDHYLYLYQTINLNAQGGIVDNGVASDPAINHGGGVLASFGFTKSPVASGSVPGTNFAVFVPEILPTDVGSGPVVVPKITVGPTSIQATWSPELSVFASSLWGYTSDTAPVFAITNISNGNDSATGLTLGTSEPSSIITLASGLVGMFAWGWMRQRAFSARLRL
jgi:hypothetical protein